MPTEPERCCFDEWAGSYARRARRRRLVGPSRDLLAGLSEVGLRDRTVLDVGCSAGVLAFETLEGGASRVTGIDLSPAAIQEAGRIAGERGLADRATFQVADGASAPLVPHDVVVLDKVFCCYPNVDRLLANSLGAARALYAFSLPPSDGLRGALQRAFSAVANRWYRLRRRTFGDFRTYVHDVAALEARVREAGFEHRFGRRRLGWDLAIYVRPESTVSER
ncbi:MAG TPA: class I SAM-dependent methyltransferase [Actinomycetota bacterium]|jgi:magnesium-protoporphyrin O-methyltransferase|nr:class I SAM-dependent methyltransferase [Actinomycetota bacterium]